MNEKRHRHRRRISIPFGVTELEGRTLLSAAPSTANWIGQDSHDLVGPSSAPGPDDVQDMHIALAGLPTGLSIVQVDVEGAGGGRWTLDTSATSAWAAALVRTSGATTADLYIEPYQVETGRTFDITLTYSDQTQAGITCVGGAADPNLRMPAAALTAFWIGQDGRDLTGPGAAVG